MHLCETVGMFGENWGKRGCECLHFEGKMHAGEPVCGDLPLKGATIGLHWNACIGRLKQARKIPGAA